MSIPYKTKDKRLDFVGNKIFDKIENILEQDYKIEDF